MKMILALLFMMNSVELMAESNDIDCRKMGEHSTSFTEVKAAALKSIGGSSDEKISDQSICKYIKMKTLYAPQEDVEGVAAIDFRRDLEFVHILSKWSEKFDRAVYSSGDFTYTVNLNRNHGSSLVVPIFDGKAQVEFRGSTGATTKFIDSRSGQSLVIAASNSQGVEIEILTEPKEATIHFNGKKYHAVSDTTSVRVAGEIVVELSKSGYKTRRLSKAMTVGQSWLIDETLEKE